MNSYRFIGNSGNVKGVMVHVPAQTFENACKRLKTSQWHWDKPELELSEFYDRVTDK